MKNCKIVKKKLILIAQKKRLDALKATQNPSSQQSTVSEKIKKNLQKLPFLTPWGPYLLVHQTDFLLIFCDPVSIGKRRKIW